MKDEAKKSLANPGKIIAQYNVNLSSNVRKKIGTFSKIKRDLRRQKQGVMPKDPSSLRELKFESVWTTTGGLNQEAFLIHDSGADSPSRAVIFATKRGLRILARSDCWFMDGNFAMAPTLFKQLYVIRARFADSAVSCVYAYLSNKTQEIYEEVLQAVLTQSEKYGFFPDPISIVTDFEQSVLKAVLQILGCHVKRQGCFYHITQAVWRKIQELGLSNRYREDENVRFFCGKMTGLAFLPLADVHEGMMFLRGNTPEDLEPIIAYFDETYVSGRYRTIQLSPNSNGQPLLPSRLRRIPPLFPPPIWNVHQATVDGGDRTNNFSETWNNSHQSLIGHKHPTIWRSIEAIRQDEALVHTIVAQDAIGQPPKKNSKDHKSVSRKSC